MALGNLEIIALILVVISAIKLFTLLVKPKAWMNFAGWIYSGRILTAVIFLVLSALVFYYLMQELTIVQIMATALFLALFFGMGYALIDGKSFVKTFYAKKMNNLWGNGVWFYTLIWLALLVWTVIEIF